MSQSAAGPCGSHPLIIGVVCLAVLAPTAQAEIAPDSGQPLTLGADVVPATTGNPEVTAGDGDSVADPVAGVPDSSSGRATTDAAGARSSTVEVDTGPVDQCNNTGSVGGDTITCVVIVTNNCTYNPATLVRRHVR